MSQARRALKLAALTLVIAVAARLCFLAWSTHAQNILTDSICELVSLPLETGLVRQTHEGLESALKARGEASACVSVVDKERSYSPDCTDSNTNYRLVMCKAKANTGIRAAVYYPLVPLVGRPLFILWAWLFAWAITFLHLSKKLTSFLLGSYTNEVSRLLYPEELQALSTERSHRIVAWLMNQFGITQSLSHQADKFHSRIRMAEERVREDAVARERLEVETNQAKRYQEKVARIHHDVRSPINSLQSIYERVSAKDAQLGRFLANAIKRIQIAMDDLGQIDESTQHLKLVIAEVAIDEVVTVMAEKFSDVKSAQLKLIFDLDALSPITVDPAVFQSVLENLLENALDAIGRGGEVQVSVASREGQCVIEIEDDGCGISDEALAKLGQRNATVDKVNGTGLGLYNVSQNLAAWNGSMKCERLKRGTRFTLTLPLTQTGASFRGLPRENILHVVDDDPLIVQVLNEAGYEVELSAYCFEDGKDLLARERGPNVAVLIDQNLGNGHLGTDLVAGQPGRRNIYLCTNDFDDPAVIRKAQAIGVKIIPKPLCFSPRI